MAGRLIQTTKSAYQYPLIFKQLWHTPRVQAPDQEIVYRDLRRFTYLQIEERIGRLASALSKAGVVPGDTVGVLEWDSHRFLEAFFAIPMMGAVLQTVNVRLSPEQIAYTIDHAGASTLLVNDEFVGLLEGLKSQLPKVKRLIVMSDRPAPQTGSLSFVGEYESLLAAAAPDYDFPDFDENTQATTFYTTGTTGLPKGVYYSHRQLVLHSICGLALFGMAEQQGRFSRDDVYMPITPMFHVHAWGFPWSATLAGVKQVYPGRYEPAMLVKLIKNEGVTFTHGVPTILQMLLDAAAKAECRSEGPQDGDRRFGLAEGAGQAGARRGHRYLRGLWDVGDRPACRCVPCSIEGSHRRSGRGGRVPRQGRYRRAAGGSAHRRPRHEQTCRTTASPPARSCCARHGSRRAISTIRKAPSNSGPAVICIPATSPWSTPNGYVHITDRIKDVIKTGGEWVSSLQIEDLISQCAGVAEAAVIGVKDDKWGERPLALVVKRASDANGVSDAVIKNHLKVFADKGIISKYGIPEKILFIDSIPKTSVGKINKKELRERYGDM